MSFRFLILTLLVSLQLFVHPVLAVESAGGVGAQVVPVSSGELVVLHVIDGFPAAKAGLLPGDLIIEVDRKTLRGSDFEDVTRNYLWGEVGSSITLAWLRPGSAEIMRAELTRVAISETLNVKPIPGVTIAIPE